MKNNYNKYANIDELSSVLLVVVAAVVSYHIRKAYMYLIIYT